MVSDCLRIVGFEFVTVKNQNFLVHLFCFSRFVIFSCSTKVFVSVFMFHVVFVFVFVYVRFLVLKVSYCRKLLSLNKTRSDENFALYLPKQSNLSLYSNYDMQEVVTFYRIVKLLLVTNDLV